MKSIVFVGKKVFAMAAVFCLAFALAVTGCGGTGSPAGGDRGTEGGFTGPPSGPTTGLPDFPIIGPPDISIIDPPDAPMINPPSGPITICNVTGLAFQRMGEGYAVVQREGGELFSGSLEIPATHNGRSVIAIWNTAFRDNQLTSVTIPGSVAYIG